MRGTRFYCGGSTRASAAAVSYLRQSGFPFSREPGPDVTDLLLDVPSYDAFGNLRDGEDPEALFGRLPGDVRIWGGNLMSRDGSLSIDLLKDPDYLSGNAAITADCALRLAGSMLNTTWNHAQILILGWGRIGKHLGRYLKLLGAEVTVAARKPSDRALLRAFGYNTMDTARLSSADLPCQVLFNTAPALLMGPEILNSMPGCIQIDLASVPGLSGSKVITARGLPGKMAPQASGALIAKTILHLGKEVF